MRPVERLLQEVRGEVMIAHTKAVGEEWRGRYGYKIHRWQTQGPWAECGPPPCFMQPSTLFLPIGSAELSLNC